VDGNGRADERDVARLDAEIQALRASYEGEIRRLDQVIALGEKGVNVAMVAAEKAVAAALAAADKATEKAEKNTEDSFNKVNEFRGALDDLGRLMATRRELEDYKEAQTLVTETMRREIVGLGSRLDTAPELRALTSRADLQQGVQNGIQLTYGSLLGLIAAASSIIGAVIFVATHH
jgi:hypothetical protein